MSSPVEDLVATFQSGKRLDYSLAPTHLQHPHWTPAEPAPPAPPLSFLVPGEMLGEYRLVLELGRGADGRVFLAEQTTLEDRPVVLKISRRRSREHLSLARLQHTHILPLFGVQEFPDRDLRILCMPYLGGTSWQQLDEALAHEPLLARSGKSLLVALQDVEADREMSLPGDEELRQGLGNQTYVEAVCRLGCCLAEALAFAHERGLVHLDVKPANILVTAAGQPVLLDFHLARAPLEAGAQAPTWLGGTRGYMAPEHVEAMAAVRAGRPLTEPVDGRADVYSLGAFLYEALGGVRPRANAVTALAPLHRLNPRVSLGLSDVVAKCLAPRQQQRYQDAAAVAEDLRRHLQHRPLRGVRNRSWRERFGKWRRRQPHALPILGLALALLIAAGTALFLTVHRWGQARLRAQAALFDGQDKMRAGRFAEAGKIMDAGLRDLAGVPGEADLSASLTTHAHMAKRAEKAAELAELADKLRLTKGQESKLPRREAYILEAGCRDQWKQARALLDSPVRLEAHKERKLRDDLWTLALSWTILQRQLAPTGSADVARERCLQVLEEAEAALGSNAEAGLLRRELMSSEPSSEPRP